MGKVGLLLTAGLMLGGCARAPDTAGTVNLINALKASGVTACGQATAAYTPFSDSFCACVSNPTSGEGATVVVGTTQCTVTTQPAKSAP